MKTVVITQVRLTHYRMRFFDDLRQECLRRCVALQLVYGQPHQRDLVRKDEGDLDWACKVHNHFFEFCSRMVTWQPLPAKFSTADLVVITQENRILSNYPLLLSRLWSKRKIAYWGHGANFQSDAPRGLREWWKQLILKRVDWWFAYTQMTVDLLQNAGYPAAQITCLDNAIDTSGFKADLASWSEKEIATEMARLGVNKDAPIGLYCGSLYADKKLELLIESADLIRQQVPDFTLLVIGDGPSMPQMREAAATRPWLHLLGVRKGREKALYFRMANVMLNPGLVGLHIVDAFCSGLVMVTTKTARHSPEYAYLRDGENGMATEATPEAFSGAVLGVLRNPARLAQMQQAALADSERYTLENMVKRFADGIEAALRG